MIKQTSGFHLARREGQLEISLYGEVDHHGAAGLRTGLDRVLREERPARLVLDLSAVEFMDSSGLGLILGRLNLMQEMGGEMQLRAPEKGVGRILQMAGLERLLPIEYDKAGGA